MAASSTLLKKRHKPSNDDDDTPQQEEQQEEQQSEEEQLLLPGLPDHLAQLCLSQQHLPASLLFSVCRPWRRLLYSPSFPPFLSLYAILTSSSSSSSIHLACFDPISSTWSPLPPPPDHPRLLLRHPSFLSRRLPIQTVSSAGKLVLLAATDPHLLPALPTPSLFDPNTARWTPAPPLPSGPRRWCAAGSAGGSLYVASGVGSDYSSETARSAERWDMLTTGGGDGGGWEAVCPLRDSRFSREPVEMVWSRWNNKLCMVDRNVKEGAVYDVGSDRWEEMPAGMVSGWDGPAAAEGDSVYVVEESSGVMRRYEWEGETWRDVVRLEGLKGACAMAAGGGKVVVASRGGASLTVVDVVAAGRGPGGGGGKYWWEVVIPEGMRVLAIHVLPRMRRWWRRKRRTS